MLQSMNLLRGTEADATDGSIGSLFDFFFDDEAWVIRYVVIDTGTWLPSRKILLATESIASLDVDPPALRVDHSRQTIEHSPRINLAEPVTIEEELLVRRHYGAWPHWAPYLVGAGPHKLSSLRDKAAEDLDVREHIPTYALHSFVEVGDFHLRFPNDSKEKLVDMLMDPATWEIQQFVFRRVPRLGPEFAVGRERLMAYDRETKELSVDLALDVATPIEELVPARK